MRENGSDDIAPFRAEQEDNSALDAVRGKRASFHPALLWAGHQTASFTFVAVTDNKFAAMVLGRRECALHNATAAQRLRNSFAWARLFRRR